VDTVLPFNRYESEQRIKDCCVTSPSHPMTNRAGFER
jgi:hypothetical protein